MSWPLNLRFTWMLSTTSIYSPKPRHQPLVSTTRLPYTQSNDPSASHGPASYQDSSVTRHVRKCSSYSQMFRMSSPTTGTRYRTSPTRNRRIVRAISDHHSDERSALLLSHGCLRQLMFEIEAMNRIARCDHRRVYPPQNKTTWGKGTSGQSIKNPLTLTQVFQWHVLTGHRPLICLYLSFYLDPSARCAIQMLRQPDAAYLDAAYLGSPNDTRENSQQLPIVHWGS